MKRKVKYDGKRTKKSHKERRLIVHEVIVPKEAVLTEVNMKVFDNTINQWQYVDRPFFAYRHAENEIWFFAGHPHTIRHDPQSQKVQCRNPKSEMAMRFVVTDGDLLTVYCFPSRNGIPDYPFADVRLGKTKITSFRKIAKLLEVACEVE